MRKIIAAKEGLEGPIEITSFRKPDEALILGARYAAEGYEVTESEMLPGENKEKS